MPWSSKGEIGLGQGSRRKGWETEPASLGLGRRKHLGVLHCLEFVVRAPHPWNVPHDLDNGVTLLGTGGNALQRHLTAVGADRYLDVGGFGAGAQGRAHVILERQVGELRP